jgi:signal peptidase I
MRFWIPAVAVALAILPLAFVHPLRVTGHSMEPTLRPGSICLAVRSWCTGAPDRGEMWLIDAPEGAAIKRVVGLPGERLEQRAGEMFLNGQRLQEPYLQQFDQGNAGPWETGPGFLLLGDNRRESHDGRAWGPLPRSAFRSKVLAGF